MAGHRAPQPECAAQVAIPFVHRELLLRPVRTRRREHPARAEPRARDQQPHRVVAPAPVRRARPGNRHRSDPVSSSRRRGRRHRPGERRRERPRRIHPLLCLEREHHRACDPLVLEPGPHPQPADIPRRARRGTSAAAARRAHRPIPRSASGALDREQHGERIERGVLQHREHAPSIEPRAAPARRTDGRPVQNPTAASRGRRRRARCSASCCRHPVAGPGRRHPAPACPSSPLPPTIEMPLTRRAERRALAADDVGVDRRRGAGARECDDRHAVDPRGVDEGRGADRQVDDLRGEAHRHVVGVAHDAGDDEARPARGVERRQHAGAVAGHLERHDPPVGRQARHRELRAVGAIAAEAPGESAGTVQVYPLGSSDGGRSPGRESSSTGSAPSSIRLMLPSALRTAIAVR